MDLYYFHTSPSRAVLMLAKTLNIPINVKVVNLAEKDQLKPQFLALNPEHVIPILVDKDLILCESGAILSYIVNQFAKGSTLYPEEPKVRAQVDRFLYFASGTLLARLKSLVRSVMYTTEPLNNALVKDVEEALGWLEMYLKGHDYIVENSITIADYALVSLVAQTRTMLLNEGDYPLTDQWYMRCRGKIPDFITMNETPAKDFSAKFMEKIEQNKK